MSKKQKCFCRGSIERSGPIFLPSNILQVFNNTHYTDSKYPAVDHTPSVPSHSSGVAQRRQANSRQIVAFQQMTDLPTHLDRYPEQKQSDASADQTRQSSQSLRSRFGPTQNEKYQFFCRTMPLRIRSFGCNIPNFFLFFFSFLPYTHWLIRLLLMLPCLLHAFSILAHSGMEQNHIRQFIRKPDSFSCFLCLHTAH